MKAIRLFSVLILFLTVLVPAKVQAQERFDSIEAKMTLLGKDSPGLFDKVELSVDGTTIQEFIRGLATANNLNVSVEPSLNAKIYNNFTNVRVIDVFMFLVRKFDLDVHFIGSIITFSQHTATPVVVPKAVRKPLKIEYNKADNTLNLDLSGDSLTAVVKEITRLSQKNVLCSPDIGGKIVNGYIQSTTLPQALNMLAFSNSLKVINTKDNLFLFERSDLPAAGSTGNGAAASRNGYTSAAGTYKVKSDGNMHVTVEAQAAPMNDVINAVSSEVKVQYFMFSEIKGLSTFNVENVPYEEFLGNILNGTDYTFRKQGNVYLIGDRSIEGLRTTRVLQLQSHEVQKMVDYIPPDLKKGVDIKMYPDLSSLILCGLEPRINEIESFIRQIDKAVPNISIEVLIVDINQSHTVATGIQAGIGTPPASAQTVFPSLDLTLSSSAINDIITGINGMGYINLGQVTPAFYLSLKALESQGILKIHSTPRLATINGTEAKMSISNTEYYLEETNQQIVTQVAQNVITHVYKPVTAELAITINPRVTGDEQVTLEITVKQSTFTARISTNAPPGNTSRDFKSIIRVKNGEMIMIGGLEEETLNETGSGVPFLSRIPIIKWFFSSRSKSKTKAKLTIFIKPTVVY